ncbi:hypothetical protein OHA72_37735 [Dactylosporangium sp. NBC_01737]|nr:hypothetical protein OHA72_37735 [Dactylosporangium sp. NBC_01737]
MRLIESRWAVTSTTGRGAGPVPSRSAITLVLVPAAPTVIGADVVA